MNLEGKLSVVTGASSGIGAATARVFAARGCQVALVGRDAARLAAVAGEIRAAGGKAEPFVADLRRATAIAELARSVLTRLGVPDVLVNNAGAGRWRSIADTTADEAADMMAVPYLAAFNLTRELLPAMRARGSGRIVNVTSAAGYLAWPNATAYIPARRAMVGFDAALSADLAGTGVGATLIVLGTVESPYWQHNPGSREHEPRSRIRPLTVEQAADAIATGVERDRRRVVKPGVFSWLFLLGALWPASMERRFTVGPRSHGRPEPSHGRPEPRLIPRTTPGLDGPNPG